MSAKQNNMTTLKAFLVSQDKTGWCKGEILQCVNPMQDVNVGKLETGNCDNFAPVYNHWQAMQLVVCDVEADKPAGTPFIDETMRIRESVTSDPDYWEIRKDYYKIIASHPQLPNTVPLPEAFILEYVRLQGDCSIEYVNDNHAAGLPLTGHQLMDKAISAKNMVFKCVPTTVIDEETGDNVLKGRRISVDMLNGLDKAVNSWSDADMEMAWKSASPDWGIIEAANFFNWLTEYKKSKK